MKYHVSAFSGPENDSFARRSATDSRINIGIGTTAAQKWDVSVFVLSPEGQCDWDDFVVVGAAAAPLPVVSTCAKVVSTCTKIVSTRAKVVSTCAKVVSTCAKVW